MTYVTLDQFPKLIVEPKSSITASQQALLTSFKGDFAFISAFYFPKMIQSGSFIYLSLQKYQLRLGKDEDLNVLDTAEAILSLVVLFIVKQFTDQGLSVYPL